MFTLINLQWQMPQFSSPCCPSKCLIFIRYLTQSILTMAGGNEGWLLRAVDMLHVRWPGEPCSHVTSITLEHFVSSHLSWYSCHLSSRQGGLPIPTGKHKICWPETWAIINLQKLNSPFHNLKVICHVTFPFYWFTDSTTVWSKAFIHNANLFTITVAMQCNA